MKFSLSGELLLKRFARSLNGIWVFVPLGLQRLEIQFDPARGVVIVVGHGQSPLPDPRRP
jgi:hypothetical protein